MRFSSFSTVCGLALVATFSTAAAQSITQDSPFGGAATSANDRAPREKLELAGISVVGNRTFICLFDTEKSRNRWLAVGEKSGDLEVVSCDVKADSAVIKVAGQLKTLGLRRATVASAVVVTSPSPAAAAVPAETPTGTVPAAAGAPPQTEQQVQEREARMLVSDLLEIGMQQRKAYEEKKSTEEAAKKAPPTAQK